MAQPVSPKIARCCVVIALAASALAPLPAVAQAQAGPPLTTYRVPAAVILPLTVGWYGGEPAPYISTEASDRAVAQSFHSNYVPRLAYAANTQAVDDIYKVTNYQQENVIPSRPQPAGPNNRDTSYTPLWQLSLITWNPGATRYLLTSEQAVKGAESRGDLTVSKTDIVINCPVIYTPSGGLFPRAKLLNRYKP